MSNTTEADIRLDERRRVAQLIEDNAKVIADFAADKDRAVLLTALVLRLGGLPTHVAEHAVSA